MLDKVATDVARAKISDNIGAYDFPTIGHYVNLDVFRHLAKCERLRAQNRFLNYFWAKWVEKHGIPDQKDPFAAMLTTEFKNQFFQEMKKVCVLAPQRDGLYQTIINTRSSHGNPHNPYLHWEFKKNVQEYFIGENLDKLIFALPMEIKIEGGNVVVATAGKNMNQRDFLVLRQCGIMSFALDPATRDFLEEATVAAGFGCRNTTNVGNWEGVPHGNLVHKRAPESSDGLEGAAAESASSSSHTFFRGLNEYVNGGIEVLPGSAQGNPHATPRKSSPQESGGGSSSRRRRGNATAFNSFGTAATSSVSEDAFDRSRKLDHLRKYDSLLAEKHHQYSALERGVPYEPDVNKRTRNVANKSAECHEVHGYQAYHMDALMHKLSDSKQKQTEDPGMPSRIFVTIVPATISGVYIQFTRNHNGFWEWQTMDDLRRDFPQIRRDPIPGETGLEERPTAAQLKDGRKESIVVFVPFGNGVTFPGQEYHGGGIRVPHPMVEGDPDIITNPINSCSLGDWRRLAKLRQFRLHAYVFDHPEDRTSKWLGPHSVCPPHIAKILRKEYGAKSDPSALSRFFQPNRYILGPPSIWKHVKGKGFANTPPIGFHRNLFATDPEQAFGQQILYGIPPTDDELRKWKEDHKAKLKKRKEREQEEDSETSEDESDTDEKTTKSKTQAGTTRALKKRGRHEGEDGSPEKPPSKRAKKTVAK